MAQFQSRRFGKYLLLEKLATGGMAQLYRAKIIGVQGFEKFIAIKMILPHLAEEKELVSSFIDEAKLAALLNHQNIVQIYDFGELEGSNFITMEYLFGKDLRAILAKAREFDMPLGLEYGLFVTSRICAGLEYAHTVKDFQGTPLNIIHRDISPQNVIVTYQGDVKIVDFGIAKAATQSTATQVGMIKGKVAYMSPEQAAGKPVDHRSDIFSLGILLYELVTGFKLFKGEDTLQILARVREADFDSPELVVGGLPPKLYAILNRALAKDVGERYQSCAEMLADIEEALYEQGLRPSARGLAQYMRNLFEKEITAEEALMRDAAGAPNPEEAVRPEAVPEPAPPKQEAPPSAAPVAPPREVKEKAREKPPAAPKAAAGSPKKKSGALVGAVVGVAVLVAVGVFLMKGKSGTSPPKETPKVEQPPAPSSPPAPAAGVEKARLLVAEATGLVEKDPSKAREMLLEAIRLDPKSVEGHFQLGLAYVKLTDYPKATEAYQKTVDLDPKFPDSFFNLGFVFASQKEYAKAEEMYGKVVALSPKYVDEALFNLAMVQDKQGKRKQSVENLERALKANPKNALAKKFLQKFKKGASG